MDDLLKPVKTVRNVKSNIEKFETLSLRESNAKNDVVSTRNVLSEVSNGTKASSKISRGSEDEANSENENHRPPKDLALVENIPPNKQKGQSLQTVDEAISSPDQASAILNDQPTQERFEAVIRYLDDGIQGKHPFNIHVPSAAAAQLLNVLVARVIPDRWWTLASTGASQADKAIKRLLLSCMSSPAGIGALLARVQGLLASSQLRQPGSSEHAIFKDTVSFFASMVYHKTFVKDLLSQIQSSGGKPGQQQALWTEATSSLAGSKILNVFLEAGAVSELKDEIPPWLQDARDYSRWLGVNIASSGISLAASNEEAWKMLASFLKRALSLGNRGRLCLDFNEAQVVADSLQIHWFPRYTCGSYSAKRPYGHHFAYCPAIFLDLIKR
jgi:hypothetical protein